MKAQNIKKVEVAGVSWKVCTISFSRQLCVITAKNVK